MPEEFQKDIAPYCEYHPRYAINFVPEAHKTYELYLAAVQCNGWLLLYVPEEFKTFEVYLAAVQHSGFSIQLVPEEFRTEELCLVGAKHIIRRIDVENHLGEDTSDFVDEYLKHVPEDHKEKIRKLFHESLNLEESY